VLTAFATARIAIALVVALPLVIVLQRSAPAPPRAPRQREGEAVTVRRPPPAPDGRPGPGAGAAGLLRDAGALYAGLLDGSWATAYLRSRGISEDTARAWQIGYAPAWWTVLTGHLRAAGHSDEEIEAAGLAPVPPAEH
jgi:hypothetical protein